MDFQDKVYALFEEQRQNWPLAKANYDMLQSVQTRKMIFKDYTFEIQFNPERIRSTAANSKSQLIAQKNCFLCPENLAPEQKPLCLNDDFLILCNPYPAFSVHLTIPSKIHTIQTIRGNFTTMLQSAECLPGFIIFYNAPDCGASAPQHLHFQAGIKDEFPVYRDLKKNEGWKTENGKRKDNSIKNRKVEDGIRNFEVITGNNPGDLIAYINSRWQEAVEPMVNILVWFENNHWTICLFERRQHRPSQFFASGDEQILVSPAAVEMAGLIITPRKEDFEKIREGDLIDIFKQVMK